MLFDLLKDSVNVVVENGLITKNRNGNLNISDEELLNMIDNYDNIMVKNNGNITIYCNNPAIKNSVDNTLKVANPQKYGYKVTIFYKYNNINNAKRTAKKYQNDAKKWKDPCNKENLYRSNLVKNRDKGE